MKPTKETTDLAMQLIRMIGSDPAFVASVAEHEINQRVAAGRLVPIGNLQVAPGLELTPTGRLRDLEVLCREVVTVWIDTLGSDPGWTDEERSLNAVLKRLSGFMSGDEDDADDEPDPDVPAAEPEGSGETAGTVEMRTVPPDIGDQGPCQRCGASIDDDPEQALRSWTRFRWVLCTPCHKLGPPVETHDDEDAEPENAGDGEEE